jgi:ATP-binding cassette subfamily G (WHITE) protein 2
MCKGNIVYHGPSEEVLPYFTEQGYQCDLHDNPADFVLDVLIDASQNKDNLERLRQNYTQSSMYAKIIADINQQPDEDDHQRLISEKKVVIKRSFCREIYYISMRTLKNAVRNPALIMSQTLIAIIMGLLVGFVFYDMKETIDPGVSNRLGAIFFIVVSQIFSTVTALEPLLEERILFIHVSLYKNQQS